MRLSSALIVFGLFLIAGALLSGCNKQTVDTKPRNQKLSIGDKEYNVEVVRSSVDQEHGLSDRSEIGADGMLFVFASRRVPGFWMVDMKFDLDFIWIKDNVVTQIDENVKKPYVGQPKNELPLYYPKDSVDSMLEVNAGFSKEKGIKVGDKVELKN